MSDARSGPRSCGRRPYRRGSSQCWQSAKPRQTDQQNDELLALASIYEADVIHIQEKQYAGQFFAHVRLPRQPFFLTGLEGLHAHSKASPASDYRVEFLPPLLLSFRLPPDYPAASKPQFRLAGKWLNKQQLGALCTCLDRMWHECCGEVILYQWCEFLTDCLPALEIEDRLDLSWAGKSAVGERNSNGVVHRSEGNEKPPPGSVAPSDSRTARGYGRRNMHWRPREYGDPRALPACSNPATLLHQLLEYDQQQLEKRFMAVEVTCNVCFDTKPGALCLRFKGCDHVSCRLCLQGYFEVQIRDGQVDRLNCPEKNCTSQATPSQVRELVGGELFRRYDELLLASTLESMADVAHCPRIPCQCPILIETGSPLGACPACRYVFCVYCKMAYHGVEPCRLKSDECRALYEEYMGGTAQQKSAMEARYGKKQLKRLVESTLSESWMEENSKECPHCKAHIEKVEGCNKMTCWKCSKCFCWLCLSKLDSQKPYEHFDQWNTPCYNRLFTGIEQFLGQEEDDDDVEDAPGLYEDADVRLGQFV